MSQGIDNRIINGDFLIDQRNAGASVIPTANQYTVDKWLANITAASKLSFQQLGVFATFANSLEIISTSAYTIGSSDSLTIQQRIEGLMVGDLDFGLSTAKTIILSFTAQASVAGTYCVTIQNGASNRSYPATFILAAATATVITLTIPGDTAGTWRTDNGIGVNVIFDLGSGSTFAGTANTWQGANYTTVSGCTSLAATNAASLQITNVRLYPASTPVINYVPRPYGEELNLCCRYFQTSFPAGTAPIQGGGFAGALTSKAPQSGGYTSVYVAFAPPMRTAPTIATYNPVSANQQWRNISHGADTNNVNNEGGTLGSTGVVITTGGTLVAGDIVAIHYTADADL